MLFNMLQANGTCSPEEVNKCDFLSIFELLYLVQISVIELLCGKNLCGDGISELVVLHQSTVYNTWKNIRHVNDRGQM